MIKALFAVDNYGGMGYKGSLPWQKNTSDLASFKRLTDNHVVVMGRRSWDDPALPKPLNGRTVYVATTRPVFYAGQIQGNIQEEVLSLEKKHQDKIIWVVGGPDIIMSCKDIYDEIVISHFKGQYRADVRINVDAIVRGFTPINAYVADDFQSVRVTYEPIFSRSKNDS